MATAANRVTQSTKLQVSAAVIEAARNNSILLQQCFQHAAQATFTNMVPAMQQQGASQAIRKQLMWGHHLASSSCEHSGWSIAQKPQLLYKSGLT